MLKFILKTSYIIVFLNLTTSHAQEVFYKGKDQLMLEIDSKVSRINSNSLNETIIIYRDSLIESSTCDMIYSISFSEPEIIKIYIDSTNSIRLFQEGWSKYYFENGKLIKIEDRCYAHVRIGSCGGIYANWENYFHNSIYYASYKTENEIGTGCSCLLNILPVNIEKIYHSLIEKVDKHLPIQVYTK